MLFILVTIWSRYLPASSWQRKYDFFHFSCQLLATSRKNIRHFTIYLPAPGNLCKYFLFFALKLLASSWLVTRPIHVIYEDLNSTIQIKCSSNSFVTFLFVITSILVFPSGTEATANALRCQTYQPSGPCCRTVTSIGSS